MTTTIKDIQDWIDGDMRDVFDPKRTARWMLSVCDTFDWGDYPVFVQPDEDLREAIQSHDGPNMTKLNEVYDLVEGDRSKWFVPGSRVRDDLV